MRDSVKSRTLLDSEFYAPLREWSWKEDQNAKGYYENEKTGFRRVLSVGSSVTGNRGDTIIVDDPLDAKKAFSKIARDNVHSWWKNAMSNRGSDPETVRKICITQRLHEDDFPGYLLREEKDWIHLRLPMEFESKSRCVTPFFTDPRTYDGELLFPERFSASAVAEEKRKGIYYFAGQQQQNPAPEGGGMFPRALWRFWKLDGISARLKRPDGCNDAEAETIDPERMRFDMIVDSWDLAFKGAEENDRVARVRVGKIGAKRFILDRSCDNMSFTKTKAEFRRVEDTKPRARKKLVEDKANGPAVIDDLTGEITGLIAVDPQGGKEARAWVMQPEHEAGNWYLPEDAPWLEEFVGEFASFPRGQHDDQVDATTQAAVYLGPDSAAERLKRSVLGIPTFGVLPK